MIYLVRIRVDWHNCDADDNTYAYKDKDKAIKRLQRESSDFLRYIKSIDREIIEECTRVYDESICYATESDDYAYMWIEKVRLN